MPWAAAPIAFALLALCWAAALQRRGAHAPSDGPQLITYFVSAHDATWRAAGSQLFELRFEAAAAAQFTSAVAPERDGMRHSAVLTLRFLRVG